MGNAGRGPMWSSRRDGGALRSSLSWLSGSCNTPHPLPLAEAVGLLPDNTRLQACLGQRRNQGGVPTCGRGRTRSPLPDPLARSPPQSVCTGADGSWPLLPRQRVENASASTRGDRITVSLGAELRLPRPCAAQGAGSPLNRLLLAQAQRSVEASLGLWGTGGWGGYDTLTASRPPRWGPSRRTGP